jgi:hypothetical protein
MLSRTKCRIRDTGLRVLRLEYCPNHVISPRLVCRGVFSALGDMPEDAGWVEELCNTQTPWLHRGRLGRLDAEFCGQV